MKFSSLLRLAAVFATMVLLAGVWASTAQAATHSLSGNARSQIGDGLPIPIGSTAAPNGRIAAVAGAKVTQTIGPDPKQLSLAAGQLKAPGNSINLGVWAANPNVFQVRTMVPISMPAAALGKPVFKAGGRFGPGTVRFCPGSVVGASTDPGCLSANGGTGIHGRMIYTKTKNQFGGTMRSTTTGASADVALNPNTALNITTQLNVPVGFAFASPVLTGPGGGTWGLTAKTTPVVPNPSGVAYVDVTKAGKINAVNLSNLGTGQANPVFSYGGPWTTGKITVSATVNAGPVNEIFVLSGSDGRVNGAGSLSMVSAALADRTLSGANANRGWLNWTLSQPNPATPAIPVAGLAAVGGLLALAGGYVLRRRK